MIKALLIAMLVYVVSAAAFTIYFYAIRTRGAGAVAARVLLLIFYGALRWALIPTAPYLVYEFIVKRT